MFYLTQYCINFISMCTQHTDYLSYRLFVRFDNLFCAKSLKFGLYFMLAHISIQTPIFQILNSHMWLASTALESSWSMFKILYSHEKAWLSKGIS
jgi:hypothetical protein